jgi:SAM-dependent methyltransferase
LNCIACQEQQWHPHTTAASIASTEAFALSRCQSCNLIRLDNPPQDLAQYYADSYHAHSFSVPGAFLPNDNSAKHMLKASILKYVYGYDIQAPSFMGLLQPLLKVAAHRFMYFPQQKIGGTLLEIGCGSGDQLKILQEVGWKVCGIEIGPAAASHARENLGLDVKTGTLENTELPPASFDTIILSHVLEHLPDPANVLARVHALLKPNGQLYLAVPSGVSWESRLFGRHWAWEAPHHLWWFSPDNLRQLLSRHGFSPETERHELFSAGIDVAISLRNISRTRKRPDPVLLMALLRWAYAPLGLLLAACNKATRFHITARKA